MAFYANAPLPDTNARQPATTIRPSSTALLTIDSEDRYKDYNQQQANPTSPYDFAISKTESLMPGFMTRLGVSEISFPWTVPNINDKTREIYFGYYVAATGPPATVVKLSFGVEFARPADIAAQIQTRVRAIGGGTALPGFTMGYDGAFSYSDPINLTAFFPLDYNSEEYPYGPNAKQLFDLLGFDANGNSSYNNASRGTTTLCQAIRYIDLVCNQLTNSQAQKDQTSQTISRDMLCRLYLNSAPGVTSTVLATDPTYCPPGCAPTILYKNYSVPKQIQWQPNQNIPGYLRFQVFDDAGDPLDLSIAQDSAVNGPPSTDWSMTLLISEC